MGIKFLSHEFYEQGVGLVFYNDECSGQILQVFYMQGVMLKERCCYSLL